MVLQAWFDNLEHLLWAGARITAVFGSAFVFSAAFVPMRIRLLLGLAVTLALWASLPPLSPNLPPVFSVWGGLIILQQAMIGLVIGWLTQWIAQGFVLLGQIIAMQSSLGFAAMMDPANGQSSSVLSQWYQWLAILLFLSFNGHLQLIVTLQKSFVTLPIGEWVMALRFEQLAQAFGEVVKVSVHFSLSIMLALLIVNLLFGVLSRVSPQINVFSLGFAFSLLGGLILMALTLPVLSNLFEHLWQMTWRLLEGGWHGG